jgi:hypothetical protein
MRRPAPLALTVAAAACAGGLQLRTAGVLLNPRAPAQTAVGRLEYRGGIMLAANDPRFGGLSDLVVSPDGERLLAVGDEGIWFEAHLVHDASGRLTEARQGRLGFLRGTDGRPLLGKTAQDVESLALLKDGAIVLGFERDHRLWRYSPGPNPLAHVPVALTAPAGLEQSPLNEGIETLTVLSDGRMLAISEGLMNGHDLVAWIGGDEGWQRLTYRADGPMRPTGAATLDNGDVVVLERVYTPERGVEARFKLIPAGSITAGRTVDGEVLAEMKAPLTVDNFEGLASRRGPSGEALLYVLSDDNLSRVQRTLLLLFALRPAG